MPRPSPPRRTTICASSSPTRTASPSRRTPARRFAGWPAYRASRPSRSICATTSSATRRPATRSCDRPTAASRGSCLADRVAQPFGHADRAHRRAVDAGVARRAAAGDLVTAEELVAEREAGAAHLGTGAAHCELVVEPERAQIFGVRLDHHHVHPARVNVGVAVPELAEVLDASDLEPPEVCGVVGDAHRVGLA